MGKDQLISMIHSFDKREEDKGQQIMGARFS